MPRHLPRQREARLSHHKTQPQREARKSHHKTHPQREARLSHYKTHRQGADLATVNDIKVNIKKEEQKCGTNVIR